MAELDNHIKRIHDKLQLLLRKYQSLQKDNDRQSILIEELKQAKEKASQQIITLQEQVSVLKAVAGQMNETDKKIFEKNINRYISEIDKCIGILSE
jgi:hypothetical protein